MEDVDRRNLILGSGALLALSACRGGDVHPALIPGELGKSSVDPSLNQGAEPWKPHPVPVPSFEAKHVALLHIYLDEDLTMHAIRVHFDAATDTANEWGNNAQTVSNWINYLNSLAPSSPPDPNVAPTKHSYTLGLTNFAFNQQHHFIIYVKNKNISYNEEYPIYFANTLRDRVYGVKVASENRSFFEAEVYDVINVDTKYSKNLIHMKNYYEIYRNGGYTSIVNGKHRVAYSLNVNATIPVYGGGVSMPIIIDPDTGNMGEGQP